jgi:RimJ/RimL family protein N-acetyltransferase
LEPVRMTLRDRRDATIREVRLDDARAMRAAFERLSEVTRYYRFMAPLKELSPAMAERSVRPLPDRERAVVAVTREDGDERIVGGARYIKEGDGETCEFAVTVADGWRGVGLASGMIRALVRDARSLGLKRMEGYVLAQNRAMLDLARRLRFEVKDSEEGPTVKLVTLDLRSTAGN